MVFLINALCMLYVLQVLFNNGNAWPVMDIFLYSEKNIYMVVIIVFETSSKMFLNAKLGNTQVEI